MELSESLSHSLSLLTRCSAQKARVAAEKAYRQAKGGDKRKTLKDWTLISCFTCMPYARSLELHPLRSYTVPSCCFAHVCVCRPDRVGVIRLLRLGGSLKREKDGFVLDLTATKLHKTSRFHAKQSNTP